MFKSAIMDMYAVCHLLSSFNLHQPVVTKSQRDCFDSKARVQATDAETAAHAQYEC